MRVSAEGFFKFLKVKKYRQAIALINKIPIHTACWYGFRDIAKVLLDHGSPLEVQDEENHGTPMSWAIAGSCKDAWCDPCDQTGCVKLLVDYGATLNAELIVSMHKEFGPFAHSLEAYFQNIGIEFGQDLHCLPLTYQRRIQSISEDNSKTLNIRSN